MEWGKFLLAVLSAGLATAMTDWFFGGILFHEKYKVYPEVWRDAGGTGENRAVAWSIVLNFVVCAIFTLGISAFGVAGWSKTMLFVLIVWGSSAVPVLITNALFIKLHPLVIVSNSLGWFVKLTLAATASVLFVQ